MTDDRYREIVARLAHLDELGMAGDWTTKALRDVVGELSRLRAGDALEQIIRRDPSESSRLVPKNLGGNVGKWIW